MKCSIFRRVFSVLLVICLLLTAIPFAAPLMEVSAVSGVNSLTCAGFISNATARNYIDTMMRYYINSSSTLQSTLDNGNSVVFMFEGGSDNYWNGTTYSDNDYSYRTQAVCIVVKKNSAGNAYIDYFCENSSSIPAEPSWCTNGVAYSGSTTLMDGTYAFYTWNHTGPYAAFQIDLSSSSGYCYYTPTANPNGYKAGASGINIHTRSTAYNGGSSIGWAWSEGCQVIGYGNDSSNEFNAFMKSVTGITWNPWISWTNKTLNTWGTTGTYKGYFVVDRQLGMIGTNGTQYGTGSLINLYNTTALTNITAKSTAARKAAGITEVTDYVSQCTFYPAYGKLTCTGTDVWSRTLPCYASVNSSTAAISAFNIGDVLTCTGLVKNTVGEYWYRVQGSNGSNLYIRAAYMDFTEEYLSDITLKDHTKPNGHVYDTGFVVDGTISTTYNKLTAVSAYVHTGFGTNGTTSTGHRVTVSNNTYNLSGSTVDSNVWMNVVPQGPNTMAIKAEYINYYVENDTTLKSNTGTVLLAEDYFMVIPASANQSSCSHTYQSYVVGGGSVSCTATAKTVKACTTCGLIASITDSPGSHSFGDWVITEATCTTSGSKVRTCTACSEKETVEIPKTGHDYSAVTIAPTCLDYEKTVYTCKHCSDSYTEVKTPGYSEWTYTKPEGIDESLIETKTEYRYSDYEEIKNSSASTSGYTQVNKEWKESKTGTVYYVPSWPSGFDTTSSIYNEYNGTKKTASETADAKTVINSDGLNGYLYYHWCYQGSYYSLSSKSGSYTTFHAYYATGNPSNYPCDTSDMSYKTGNTACCTNSDWYFVTNVNAQKYTEYTALYTHARWTDFTEWSETPATASDTRRVETRTKYRYYIDSPLGDHNYVNGICSVCGKNEASDSMYLFGFINGADYGYGDDSATIGIYKFTDGKLTASFSTDSYVGVKKGDNSAWFMATEYPGDNATSIVLQNADGIANPEKLRVPAGKEILFTLTDNGNGTYTLSYETSECKHTSHSLSGICSFCGEETSHNFRTGSCTICSKPCTHSFTEGVCTVCDYPCRHSFYQGECVVCKTPCEHNFDKGFCTVCSAPCSHSFNEGICTICQKECTHIYKNGVCTICEIPCSHSFSDGMCITCKKPCDHSFENGICTICNGSCSHNFELGVCTLCSKAHEEHTYEDTACTVCGAPAPDFYLFGYINGKVYACGEDEENTGIYKFTNGTLKAIFTEPSFVSVKRADNSEWYLPDSELTDEYSAVLCPSAQVGAGDGLFVPKGRLVTFNLSYNGDGTYTLSYTLAPCRHISHDTDSICLSCGEAVPHSFEDGVCTVCALACAHSFEDGICRDCAYKCTHSFEEGVCTDCNTTCVHSFENGKCTNCLMLCKHSWENGLCTICSSLCEHILCEEGCKVCKKNFDFYLAGYINGDHEGCEENFELLTPYLFQNGKTSVAFTSDSYVFLKTHEGEFFFMTEDGTFESEDFGAQDMMYIPAGVDLTFTLRFENGEIFLDKTITSCDHINHSKEGVCTFCGASVSHSFNNSYCTVCGLRETQVDITLPEISAKYAYLSDKDGFTYSVVFSPLNFEIEEAEAGLLLFTSSEGELTFKNAHSVVPGISSKGTDFEVHTEKLHPKTLGDTVYLRVYAKLSDGSFVYSHVIPYSGAQYAYSVLRSASGTQAEKAYAVSLLDFISQMQIFSDYNTENLANEELTEEEKSLTASYQSTMAQKVKTPEKDKCTNFTRNAQLDVLYPTAILNDGIYSLNINLKLRNELSEEVTLYYWDENTYCAESVLTKENASGVITMTLCDDGTYKAELPYVNISQMNSAVYFAVTYKLSGFEYSLGVNALSLSQYLSLEAENAESPTRALAQASVVYGYYAKNLLS